MTGALPPLALERAACPGCASEGSELLYRARDAIYRVDCRAFPLQRCTGCGLVYLGDRPTRESIARAYPESYMWRQARVEPRPGHGLDEQLIARYFRQFYARRARAVLPLLAEAASPRVLDLGAGGGHFLAALARERGGDYLGIDFAVDAAPPGLRMQAGDLNALALGEGGFELVTFWHVLEHLHDPRSALAAAFDRLRPGGYLLVATQNFDALSRHLMGRAWPLNDVPRHLVHFTPATLGRLVEAAGFEPGRLQHLTEYFPVLGGHLFPRAVARADGSLRAWPGLLLSAFFAPLELAAIASGRGCTFNLIARRPA